ncbi:hypothetical protein [Sorangium sp. So ce1182]|uniref:hypothetical protein n=1 Tax=Sorangium sp. So ce1182 TaxID=3133334 RepID=UPI003F62322E
MSEKAPAKAPAAKEGTSAQTSPRNGETGGKSTTTQQPASAAQGTTTSPSASKSPPGEQGSQEPGRGRPGPQPGSSSTTTAPAQGDTLTWIAANAVTKSKWRTSTGKGMRKKAKRAIPKLAGPLTSGGFPAQPVDAKKQIGKRFPKGKLFSDAEWDAFKELSSTPEGRTWLNASGMLTHGEIEQYLSNDNPERFRGFHLLHKPSKVVMASYVSRQMNGGEDGKRFEGTPPAAIALSMEARHTTDPARKEELKRQIDQGIANEWAKTFEHTEPNADTIKAMDQSAVLAPRTLKETLTRADIKTLPKDEALARHRQSIVVLKNIFHLLQAGAEIYDAGSKKHVPLQGVPVAKLLSHGGRVNIQVPKGSPPYALTEFLGITDRNGNPTTGVFKRDFGTHHMALSWGKFKEEGGHFAAVKSALDDTELYGMNPAIGGLGLKDFNGDIILPDGAHGHVFIGYRPPKPGRRGALQIGMETTGPGAPSTVGYVHNARSTEKTANPISSVGGLKQDKIGDEKGKNARTVDLRKLGDDWGKTLKDRADQFEHDFKENPTEAIKDLVGPREIPPQETQHTAPLASDSSDDAPDDAPDDSSDAGSDRSERGSRGGDRRAPPGDAASDPKRGAQDPGQGSSDQRPRGDEQSPKGNEPREMPGDAPEQMTAKTPEASSPRPEAGTTQSAPGKAPERPGQPQPETTSQSPTRGPGSPATVITTGMKTPAGSPEASVQGSAAASATPDPGTLSSRDDESVEDDIENTTDPVVNVLSDDYVHGSNNPEDGDDSEGDDSDDEGDDSDDEGDDSDDEGDDSDDEGDDSDDEGDDDSDDEGDDDSDDEGDDDSDDEGDDDSDDEGDDDSDDEGEIENTTDLVMNALPDDYVHGSMVTFDPTNVPRPLASPKPTQAGIERILERWGFSDDVFFNRDLGIDGLTRPGEDPDIGPGPFEGTVFPAGGFGVPVTLPPELVELRVALTIAHELSHGNQYDNLDLIDLEGREDEIDRLPPPERDAHQTAFERQKAALEVVGYQSEIVNLERFRQMLNDDEARVYHDGLQAMEDQARTRRDEFFEQLTPEQQAIFIQDGIEAVLEDIQRGLDVNFFRNNAPDADEEDAGDEDQSRDDEDDSDDERKDDSDDEHKDDSDDEGEDGSDDEGEDDSDDEGEDGSDDEGEDDSDDEGEDDSDDEGEDDSDDEGEDDSDDEGEDDSDDEGEDDSDDEGEDDSEDHNGDRAGPSQRPQSGGQPRPETTSQPPAQRSATPATAITTGMQAPVRPPASTKVGWLGKKLGTGGHGFGGMISNEGADQREQALADQYALQIGPDEDTGGAHFSHKMLDHIEKALGDLPPEHVTGSPTLRKIIRDISSEQAASAYDELTDTINIVNPPKVPTFIYSRLNRRWNWQRKRMDRGAIRDYDGVNKEQDRALGITEGRHVMGGTSDVLANGSLIKWTMRHEIGHSIDKLIDWKGNHASDPRFGGWKVHSDTRDTEEVARAILDKAGITDDEANSETDGVSLLQRFASFLHAPSRRKDMTPLEDFPDDAASEDPGLKKKLEKAVDTVKFAMAQPWTLDDGGASRLEVDGRIYQVDHYDQWVSYSADARNNAVSNYQFSTPAEWFAETYASYYDPNPAPRAQLTQQVRDFFANDLPGLITGGQERWERINENTRMAEEGIGPQPPQPPAGSSASPSAVSPSAVTAGMSRNIATGTPSSGSRAASPPRDATGAPQGSSPRDANGGSQASQPRDATGAPQGSSPRDANGGSQASPPRDATRAPNDSAVLETDGAREGLGNTQAALQALIDASKTWSHPANPANKQEAKELLGDIMRSQGVDRSLVDRLAELIDAPDSLSQHEFAICALQSVLRTQLTSDLAGFARVVAAEFTGKLFDRDGKQIADFSLDNQGEHRATTSTQATDDPIQSVIRGDLPLNDAPIGNKLLQNGVKKAGVRRADVENKGRAWSDKHVLDYLLARGLGKMLSKLAPEQYKADAEYTAGVIPGYLDKAGTRDKDATGPSKKLGDLQLSADSLVTIFTNILGGDAQTMVDGDSYDVDRINDALARPEQAPFAVATFLDGKGLVKRADQSAEDPTKVEPFDKAVTSGTSSAHQVVINGKITEDGDHYVVPLHTWQQSFSIKVKKDLLPSLFPVFTYGTYLPSQAPGTNDPALSQAPKPNAWTQLTTGGGDPLGTGGHGLAGLVSNKGADQREQALADQYELQIGPDEDADGKHFSHKMLAHIEKALSELPPTHITGSPTLRKIIRTLSSEQAASEYDEETDTINIVNPPKVPTFIYSRLNRRWNWQRKRMDRGALRDYPGVSKEQDEALGIVGRRQVMGGVSDVLANGNLLKWTIRHEVAHSIDKLVDWGSLAHEDRFGGWQEHADSRELQAVARAIFDKAGISDDKAQQKLDDEGQSDPGGFPLIERFASLLDPELRRTDMTPLESFPAKVASTDPDLKDRLERAVRTVKIAMAQPWTLSDGGSRELEVDGRIYHVDPYNTWVSYRADARSNAVSNYQFSTPKEWFAETYASYHDPDPAPRDQLTQEVRDFFRNELPDLVTAGRASWQRIRENIARSAGNRPGPSAITTGFNPAASADPNSLGEGQTSDPADMLGGYNPASNSGDRAAAPQSQLDEIQEEPEPASERAPDPATSTPVEEVTWIVDKAVKNTIWRTDTGPLSRDRAKQGLSAIQGPLSASGFPPDPTTAKEQLGGRFPGGPLFSDAEWSAFVQLSSTPQGQTWLNASGMLTHEQVEQYLSGNDDDNPERFRGFDKLHNASKVVLASYVSRQMNGGEDGKRFEGTPPAAAAISMEARHTTDPIRRAELKRLIDQGIIEEWSKTFEYTQPNEAATTAINKGAVLAPKSLLNRLTFTKGKELSKAEVIKRHGQSLEVLKNVFHLLQEGAEIYDADAKSHVPLQDVPVAKLLSHGGRVNVQIPPSSSPYALTEHLGITDSKGKPRPGVFKRFAGTHHVSFADGEFKEEGGRHAFIKAKLDDTELYGINLAVGGLGLKDFNGDVILPDGAHGHLFIGYRPPKPGRPGALQIGMETTGPNAPSTVGYVHNLGSTEKTANPISSVGGLKQDKIGDESTKNARTVDLGKLGSDWRKTLKDRADRFEQDLKQKGKDALTELLGPRTQPPQELQDAQQRSGEPAQEPRDNEAGTAQRTGAPANVLAGYNPALDGESVALDPQAHTDSAQVEPSPRRQDKTLDELLSSLDEQSRAWSGPANDDLRQQAADSLAGLLESLNVDRAIVDRLRELIANPASLSQSAFSNCGVNSALYTMLKGDLATTSHLIAALFTGRLLGRFAQAPGARELGAQQDQGKAVLSEDLDVLRRVMTGEIPRALGPAPTRPLVNGLKTAGAKRGGLNRAADRQQLDRHLLDHLLARGLVELLGQDAVAQHGKRTDDARQPGVVAAEGDLLLSANSIATLLRDALGAEVAVTSGGPSGNDVARINETLRRTDRAGFAVATVSNGKALWEAAKKHRDGDSDATPRAPATVAPLGKGEAESRHHFAIDGEIKADGDAFIVPVQSWGQSFPIRVQKADMPRLFEVVTLGTYPPPRAPALGAPAQQQAPAPLASRGRSGTAVDAADPRDQLAGAPASQHETNTAGGPAVAPGALDPGTIQRTPSGLDRALLERVPEHRLNEVTRLVIDTIDSELLPQLLNLLPIAQLAATRLAEEIVAKWLTFNPDLLDLPAGELKGRLAAHAELVLGMLERDRGRSTLGRKGGSSAAAPAASAASSAPQPPEGTPAPREELEDRARESSSSTSSAADASSDAGAPARTTEPEVYESLFADLDDSDFISAEEHKQKERAARNQEKLEKPARNNDEERAIPEWIWGVPHYAALQTALLAHFDDDAVQRALAELLATTESAETPVPFAEFVAIALREPRDAESLKQEAVKLFGSYHGELRKLVYDAAEALGALDWAGRVPDFDIEALRDPPPPPPTGDAEPPRSVLKRGQEGRWVTRAELEIINRSIGEHAFAGMLARAMNKGKISGTRATIEQLVRQAERLASPALSPPLTSTSLVVDTNLVEALLTPPRELPLSKRHLREQLDALIREHGITDLRLANINIGELFQHDSIVGRTFTTSDGREIPWYGIQVHDDRRDDTADYALGFEQLASGSVGERKGSADRSMVADAFFSDRESDEDGAPAVPHFATADHGILTPLLSFAGIDAKRRGEKAFIDFVKENSRNGTTYFEPELKGRKLKAHTILNLETAGIAAARDAQPAQSEPIGAALLDTPVGATHRVHDLISLIRAFGFDVYIVGGAVRDALSGKKPKDVDLKTNMPMSRLEEVLRTDPAFKSLPVTVVPELRLLQVGGVNTMVDITAGDDTSVQGPLDVMADAQKRDFRMNALYLDENGFVVDPLDGAIEDQLVGRLRFVADPGPTAPVEERQKAVVENLRRAPWNLGRALKFYQRGYEIEPEILHAVLDNAESILASMKEREAPLHAKSLVLHSTQAESPTGLAEIMRVLGFSPQAIRELIPDDVAGRFDDESLAYENDVLPRWRETPDDDGAGYPLAAPEMKIDLATGRIYQYRFHAIAPQQEGQAGERVIIDVDLSDHNQPGHHAPHYHVYRWRKRDGQLKWDKKKNGFSDTGQPGLPEIADGRYLGPQPWRFEEGLDSDSGDFLDVAKGRIREAGIELRSDGDLLDLGGQVKLHPQRLRELVDRGQFGKLLMLVKNLNNGLPWSSRDQATVDLSGSHRGQERLRFKPQLDLVVPFLRDGGIEDPTSMAIFAENGEMRHDALLRLYDLVSGEERPDLRRPAAAFARERAESVSEFVERFEFYVASMKGNLSGADVEALWQAQLKAAQEANAVGDVTLPARGELAERLAAAASELRFESASAAAYHAAKHGDEFLSPEQRAASVPPEGAVRRYLDSARDAVRKALQAGALEARTDETGATNVVLWDGTTKVIARVGPDGTAHILSSYVKDRRSTAPAAAFTRPGAPSSAAATSAVTEPEGRAPADRLGAYSPWSGASEGTQGPQAPQASGAPAALDGDDTIPAPIDAIVRTLVARTKSGAWSSPRTQADKREAIALVTELLQQLGMDAKVVDRGEQGKDAPDDEHSACTCVR